MTFPPYNPPTETNPPFTAPPTWPFPTTSIPSWETAYRLLLLEAAIMYMWANGSPGSPGLPGPPGPTGPPGTTYALVQGTPPPIATAVPAPPEGLFWIDTSTTPINVPGGPAGGSLGGTYPNPTAALPVVAGSLASPYTFTTALATFLTTPSLAVGTWEFDFGASCAVNQSASIEIAVNLGAGTVGTLAGKTSAGENNLSATASANDEVSLHFTVVITTAGPLVFQGISSVAGGVIASNTFVHAYPGATGYKGTKVVG